MLRGFAGILTVVLLFLMVLIIPRGYSQLNVDFNYLVDKQNNTIEINLTAPVYINSIPLEVYDGDGRLLMKKTVDRYLTKRMDSTRFNRFILNISLPQKMPARVILFPGSTLETTYTLVSPQVQVNLTGKQVKIYLTRDSKYSLVAKAGSESREYNIIADEEGWYSVSIDDLPREFLSPGASFYSTIRFPGGLNTTVARHIPVIKVEAGDDYTRIKGSGISGDIPRITVLDDRGIYKGYINEVVSFKEGDFIIQDSGEEDRIQVRDGYTIAYNEKGYYFKFNIPYFFAVYHQDDNTIEGTVSRQGKVVFRYGRDLLEAVPDMNGRFKIYLGSERDVSRLINIKGGYISPAGNEYWKNFDWGYILKATPLINTAEMDLRVMTYNIHHGISAAGHMDLDAIASVIEESGAQIIGLQEVDKRFIRTLFRDQVKELAQKLNMYYCFGETFNILGAEYGNAVLSKFPITSVNNLQLDSTGEPRGIISAAVDVNGKVINFLVTHLSLSKNLRNVQIQQIKRYLDLLEDEVILVGDLNATPEQGEVMYIDRYLKNAVRDTARDRIGTYEDADGTQVQIDYIFISPEIRVKDVFVVNSPASDHLPLIADIGVKDM